MAGMADEAGSHGEGTILRGADAGMTESELRAWFLREVFPYEGVLMQFLHQNWRNQSDIADLRQEVYVRVYEAAQDRLPEHPKTFLLRTAHNLLVDRVRREQIVPIAAVADLDALGVALEAPGPERSTIAKDMLRRLQSALDRLPPRCREAVVLKQIEGLSRGEIAERMGITPDAVSQYLSKGVAALAEELYGELSDLRRGV
jgi:RNA polymerase sigma-70 factor (ECF subfamily)